MVIMIITWFENELIQVVGGNVTHVLPDTWVIHHSCQPQDLKLPVKEDRNRI